MATRCIDISENKKLGTVSPIAMFVFVGVYIVLTALMDIGLLYIICIMLAYFLCIMFFHFTPRFVWLTIKFLTTNAYLTPTFNDERYIDDETQFTGIKRVLPELE